MPSVRRAIIPLLIAFGVLAAAGAVALLYSFDPAKGYAFFPPCRFYEMTGLRCPGCGATRATHHLLHFRVGAAFYHNALYVAVLPLGFWWGSRQIWRQWTETPAPPAPLRRHIWLTGAWLAAIFGFWVIRNLPWWPLL